MHFKRCPQVLEHSVDVWMTAPDLVKEIKRTGIRDWKYVPLCLGELLLVMLSLFLSRSAYPQAVRSLRSALNFQSRKENGLFSRMEEEYNIYFALRKVGRQSHVHGWGEGVPMGQKSLLT